MGRPGRDHRAGASFERRSLEGAAAGLAVIAVVALIDAVASKNAILIGLLIVGPLVAATRSGTRDVPAVAIVALTAGVLLGIPDHVFGTVDHLTRLLIVAAGGGMAAWISTIRASRERTVEAVRESEARKTAVAQAALDCIVTMDAQGIVVEFNPAAERTFGYSVDEAIGRPLAELIIPPDLREGHRQGLARYLATREPRLLDRRIEMRAVRKDGGELPVELTITAIGVEPPVFTGHLRDLTERREVEALQQRMAAIAESSDDAILSKDHDLIIRSWNRGAERLYGYTPEEAFGQPIQIINPARSAG